MNFLFRLILRLLMGPMFFFAAGTDALAGLSDGGDAGAIAGAGEDADLLGGEDTGDLGEDTEDPGDLEDDTGGEEARGTEAQTRDARMERGLPKEVREALTGLKQSNPKAEQAIRRALFSQRAWSHVIPGGIQEARQVKAALEEIGGLDGIQTLQEEKQAVAQELETINRCWEDGDAKFLRNLVEEKPENVGVMLECLREHTPEAYNFITGRIFWNTIMQNGWSQDLASIYNFCNANKAKEGMGAVLDVLTPVLQSMNAIRELAGKQPEKKVDKDRERLQAEREKFDQERRGEFLKLVNEHVATKRDDLIANALARVLKTKGVDVAKMRRVDGARWGTMRDRADALMGAALRADKAFMATAKRLAAEGNRAKLVTHYANKMKFLLLNNNGKPIARDVANLFYRGKKVVKQNSGEQQNQGGGVTEKGTVRLNARPDGNLIDWTRTTDDDVLAHKVYLKGKKEAHVW